MGNAHGLETLIAAAEELQTALPSTMFLLIGKVRKKTGSQNSPPSADFRILNSSVSSHGNGLPPTSRRPIFAWSC